MSMMDARIETALEEIETLSSKALREHWSAMKQGPAPRISPSMLRLALAREIQARALGGHDRAVSTILAQRMGAKTVSRVTSPGMRLVRSWNGIAHVVTISDNGAIHWNGKVWNSLSEVARAITGTRWSGPAFFGLKKKAAA